jgi:hypothetical protein
VVLEMGAGSALEDRRPPRQRLPAVARFSSGMNLPAAVKKSKHVEYGVLCRPRQNGALESLLNYRTIRGWIVFRVTTSNVSWTRRLDNHSHRASLGHSPR